MKIRHIVAAAVMAASPVLAWPASGTQQLRDFVAQVQSASGRFTQQAGDRQGAGKPAQTGEFSFQRPGKFKWDVRKPYEQLIISDGKRLYQYDPDLAQVTERNVDQSIGASPAAILFGSGALEDVFELQDLPPRDGLEWLRAKPRSADAGFTHVEIGFKGSMPQRIDLLDSFGQTTRISLTDIRANPKLDAAAFKFTPPPGVDVVKMQ
ncbi:outer membrane lipoprotein chaperone LolA [Parapusillimonas granuli]|uniref:Outer-membrane lipoprotein carrier protein n=1 Tax=Parapusillimonas granuli TaxID=380911 RepID=A0A853G401_9BURK|nr:outer membrane lipoprotein chaperone LolA [Parapusillimonas granuli]MBB5214944.1 outer membrane lipoprotein carrier protein [Parapusillimonas granuli]MEB2401197.1 outer membrane lipoprotein chaperone LolA [Alcaligenaceae bacterium]NYT49266.1 outer membrane lipoprotein chaperone LolA [Parapusillimonas granuli]